MENAAEKMKDREGLQVFIIDLVLKYVDDGLDGW